MSLHPCLIALGANLPSHLGGPERTLAAAIRRLSARGVRCRRRSRWFRSSAWRTAPEPDYVNGVMLAWTRSGPWRTLRVLQCVEASLGRRRVMRTGPRRIDLDLLAHGARALPDRSRWRSTATREERRSGPRARLVIPHPLMHLRAFVLVPLGDFAPRWRHPVLGTARTVLCGRLPEGEIRQVVPLSGTRQGAATGSARRRTCRFPR